MQLYHSYLSIFIDHTLLDTLAACGCGVPQNKSQHLGVSNFTRRVFCPFTAQYPIYIINVKLWRQSLECISRPLIFTNPRPDMFFDLAQYFHLTDFLACHVLHPRIVFTCPSLLHPSYAFQSPPTVKFEHSPSPRLNSMSEHNGRLNTTCKPIRARFSLAPQDLSFVDIVVGISD